MSRIFAPSAHARADGAAAFRAGQPFQSNPHELGTTRSREWSKGWRDGEAAIANLRHPRAPP